MILSLDPGSSRIGWAITSFNGDIVEQGFLSPANESNKKVPFNKRMNILIKALIVEFEQILKNEEITHVAWEIVPSFGRMAQRELVQATATTLKVLTFQKGFPYQQFTPGKWHKQLMGTTTCTKEEVRSKVLEYNILRGDDNQIAIDYPYDVYDAIAIGLAAGQLDEWIIDELVS